MMYALLAAPDPIKIISGGRAAWLWTGSPGGDPGIAPGRTGFGIGGIRRVAGPCGQATRSITERSRGDYSVSADPFGSLASRRAAYSSRRNRAAVATSPASAAVVMSWVTVAIV